MVIIFLREFSVKWWLSRGKSTQCLNSKTKLTLCQCHSVSGPDRAQLRGKRRLAQPLREEEKIKGREMRQGVRKKGSGGERQEIGIEKKKWTKKGWQEERERRD